MNDQTKTLVAAAVTGVAVAVATNYGMKAYDRYQARKNKKILDAEKKNA